MPNMDLLNFKATDIEGSVLWLDAADSSTVIDTTTPGQVEQWNDKSGQGNNATQGTGTKQPTYTSNGVNGLPSLVFDDTFSQNLLVSSFGSFMSGNDKTCTIFAVAEHSEAVQQYIYSFGNSASDNAICGVRTTTTTGKHTFVKRDDAAAIKGPIGTNNPSVNTPYIIASVIASDGLTVDTYINGTQDIAAGDIDVGTTTIDEFMIGGIPFAAAPAAPWTGKISEILIYNRSLSTAERSVINAYLGLKWGISVPEPVPYALDGGILTQPTPLIDLLKDSRTIDGMTNSFISALPKGYLYESPQLQSFFKGFMGVYQEVMLLIEKAANDQFYLNDDSIFIDEYLTMYGLPNILFPEIENRQDALFAISMMKLSSSLLSKQDFENFLALLGFNVTFYPVNSSIIEYETFNYTFPILFSNSITKKDKLTYWIYVEEDDPIADPDGYNNIGDAFDIDFITSPNKLQQVQKILAFLKPDYLIFQYISLYTKNLYGL